VARCGKCGRWALGLCAWALAATQAPSANAQAISISRAIVDTPTAGLIPPGSFETRTRVFPGGGLQVGVDIGLTNWLGVGGSYGAMQIIGDGDPDWYPAPGFFVKARVIPETFVAPAIVLGLDTQGGGFYDDVRDRYQFKSRGVYAVASKNYAWLGDLSLHGGVSRSLEDRDDGDLTPFLGLEKSFGALWGLGVEYDLATNDNEKDGAYGRGRGYLNAALHWNFAPRMQLQVIVRDMLENSESIDPTLSDVVVDEGWGREFAFSYVESF
jgi:hypothetical protein